MEGPTALVVNADGDCLAFFLSPLLSPSLGEMVRIRLKYWLKEPLNTKEQPTNYMNV